MESSVIYRSVLTKLIGFTTRVAHLLIPKIISFLNSPIYERYSKKFSFRACLDEATKSNIISKKSPPQQY